jgi:thermitase
MLFARPLALFVLILVALVAGPAEAATVIVKYRRGVASVRRHSSERAAGVRGVAGSVRGQGARVLRVAGDPEVAAARLRRDPGVLYAEPNAAVRALAAPHDPLFAQLDGLAAIHAVAGWDALGLARFPATGGVPVGIVDTGIDAGHEDLAGKIAACATSRDGKLVAGSCADDNDHGTHVAGTIGAVANNGTGIAGVAFASPLIVCRALSGPGGSGTVADVANCIAFTHARGAKVVSMSLGGGQAITLRNAVRAAWAGGGRRGSVLVAAAGNDGDARLDYPAGYPEVVSVAAVDGAGRRASFSNANADVEVAAPGVDVLSTKRGGGYVRFSGTSMATPHAAGAAALLWGAHRRSTAQTIRDRLDSAVADLGAPGRDREYGFGLVDLARVG